MLKLNEKLSQYWGAIQGNLFPWLEEDLGPLTQKQQQLVTVLELARLEEFIRCYAGDVGRPQNDRSAIARAFVAKAVYNLNTTRQLLDRLQSDKVLRRLCGWETQAQVPSESTFSRAFAEFAMSQLPQRVHEVLIKHYESMRLVGHISRDSTAIASWERVAKPSAAPSTTPVVAAKRGRPKKGEERPAAPLARLVRQLSMGLKDMLDELPTWCDIGTKRNSKGHQESWKGFKLHLDSADGAVPISAVLTSASLHDSQVAIPLATLTAQRVVNLYDLMDSAYDAQAIREHSERLGHVPLIDFNPRRGDDPRCFLPHEAVRYKERSTAERVNSRLKGEFGGLVVRVRGHAKVMAHLMFGVIALTVDQLLRLLKT